MNRLFEFSLVVLIVVLAFGLGTLVPAYRESEAIKGSSGPLHIESFTIEPSVRVYDLGSTDCWCTVSSEDEPINAICIVENGGCVAVYYRDGKEIKRVPQRVNSEREKQ